MSVVTEILDIGGHGPTTRIIMRLVGPLSAPIVVAARRGRYEYVCDVEQGHTVVIDPGDARRGITATDEGQSVLRFLRRHPSGRPLALGPGSESVTLSTAGGTGRVDIEVLRAMR